MRARRCPRQPAHNIPLSRAWRREASPQPQRRCEPPASRSKASRRASTRRVAAGRSSRAFPPMLALPVRRCGKHRGTLASALAPRRLPAVAVVSRPASRGQCPQPAAASGCARTRPSESDEPRASRAAAPAPRRGGRGPAAAPAAAHRVARVMHLRREPARAPHGSAAGQPRRARRPCGGGRRTHARRARCGGRRSPRGRRVGARADSAHLCSVEAAPCHSAHAAPGGRRGAARAP